MDHALQEQNFRQLDVNLLNSKHCTGTGTVGTVPLKICPISLTAVLETPCRIIADMSNIYREWLPVTASSIPLTSI